MESVLGGKLTSDGDEGPTRLCWRPPVRWRVLLGRSDYEGGGVDSLTCWRFETLLLYFRY